MVTLLMNVDVKKAQVYLVLGWGGILRYLFGICKEDAIFMSHSESKVFSSSLVTKEYIKQSLQDQTV